MASTSRAGGVQGKIRQATSTICDDNQSLVAEIRKGIGRLKDIAVDLERDNQSQKAKELENAVLELIKAFEDCQRFSMVVNSVGDAYEPGPELTDFGKLFDNEMAKLGGNSSSVSQNHPLLRQFRQAIWDVHHHGQPMPGEEQEDIVMTSTQTSLLNVACPLSGKPVTELSSPVRGMDCKHVYEKQTILIYIRSKGGNAKCPIPGCPRVLHANGVICDPLLLCDIEELRSMNKQNVGPGGIEDVTELVDDDREEDD
ncbi:E3 SUMO-protein ligase MMS21 [Punica granatum]|uniref:SP-RING-type domain-containing protein n=2 Tax=Punica granatum TaxID=22663 RepID=A0A218XWH5_PUNGR|nr:E3 SUMO-protein ligase MMS21 [Punica granatum]OWM88632.1 hypothetical protein CDL15_Pgr002399 [Punica granatum]PKI37668.1 hypothetical protein CRG98_041961 [Punica granatum]